ncbi:uncharacterized protein BX663DRAFT_444068, partial [Cokeromyces recurvatus]|uniref:uncharacterized protein n=1 Tax=Cokeromyces recurvatus TaxID=90255 RepID=UPI00221F6F62
HAIYCLQINSRLQMPETVIDPHLNCLPCRKPQTSQFIRWSSICILLHKLDYL